LIYIEKRFILLLRIILISNEYRYSKQRERILEILKSTDRHPTADWIYEILKKEFPNLSLGTVYRNLNILFDMGSIDRIDFGSTFDRFEAKIEKHYHLICECCGSITDIKIPKELKVEEIIKNKVNFKIKTHKVQIYGLCENCMKK
jgi:Fur family peroxide stress response transcriptional regulator